jgi:hypothetical protein
MLFWLSILSGGFMAEGWMNTIILPKINPRDIIHQFMLTCGLIFIPVSVAGSIGLLRRRDWGRKLVILAMILNFPFIMWIIARWISSPFDFGAIIMISIMFFIPVTGFVTSSIIILNRPQMKEVFKSQQGSSSKYIKILVPVILGISILAGIGLPLGYHYVSETIEAQKRIYDFNRYQGWWNDNKITDYSFKLTIAYGGYLDWEGFGGMREEGIEQSELIIEVRNGTPVSVIDIKDGQSSNMSVNQYSDTIPELFSIVDSFLKGTMSEDVTARINSSSELQLMDEVFEDIPFSVSGSYD